ncbi:MAG: BtpA/SgcQ family protein [Planctomycetes bacterium]|nr:BtpA/SgcQ family protein [Planctomycetota bacterium]
MHAAPNSSRLLTALRQWKVLLGVVHLDPLPGSPHAKPLDATIEAAKRDAGILIESGFDGYVVENFGDTPFFPGAVPPHVLTAMTRVALALPRQSAIVGVNVLRNDARGALAVALGAGLDFVRVNVHCGAAVTDQGIVEGVAAKTLRERAQLVPGVAILADVDVKHATPLGAHFDIEESARDTAYRGLADGLIVTGSSTGSGASFDDLRRVTKAVPDRPVFVGSGVTDETVAEVLRHASGVIVGTALKTNGNVEQPIDATRARRFVDKARNAEK